MGRAAGVPPTNMVDCCIVSPHRAGNTCNVPTVHLAVGRVVIVLDKHVEIEIFQLVVGGGTSS